MRTYKFQSFNYSTEPAKAENEKVISESKIETNSEFNTFSEFEEKFYIE